MDQIDVRELGLAILTLGGGRKVAADSINPHVGLSALKRVGDSIAPGEPVAIIHGDDASQVAHAESIVMAAYRRGEVRRLQPVVAEVLS